MADTGAGPNTTEIPRSAHRSVSPPWGGDSRPQPIIAMALPMIRNETPSPKPSRPKSMAILDTSSYEAILTAVTGGGTGKSNLQRRSEL